MAVITFEEIRARVEQHQAAEAARNAPPAVACAALDDLRESLTRMVGTERREILDELAILLAEMSEPAPIVA